MVDKALKILIAGGGIGGLAAASSLISNGYTNIEVYEQAQELKEIGAGVQLSANATNVLKANGMLQQCLEKACLGTAQNVNRFDTGDLIATIRHPVDHEERYGAPWLQFHRAHLLDILVAKLNSLAPNAVHLGKVVTGYTEDAEGVSLHFADGESARGNMLIGADGVKSRVRQQVQGEHEPNWTGYIAWRTTVPTACLPKEVVDKNVLWFVGPGKNLYAYRIAGGELMNVLGVRDSDTNWGDNAWVEAAPWEDFKDDFAGWADDVQTLIDAANQNDCARWGLHNHLPIDNWSTERVTLLGDAAHATLPYLGQGAGMAIEDGWILARSLKREGTPADALKCYQRNRIERCTMIQQQSTQNLVDSHRISMDTMAEAMQAMTESKDALDFADWLYGYNPLDVELI